MKLDFSKLDELAYRGFDTPEAKRNKDDLIEKGFTFVDDDKDNPFIGPRLFKSVSGLDYRAFYGDLYRWHKRYYGQVLQDSSAWNEAFEAWSQLCVIYNADSTPYVQQVLLSVYEELEREWSSANQ